jgi:hypothetical protein
VPIRTSTEPALRRQHLDPDWKRFEAAPQREQVLLGQDRGRSQQRGLLAVEHALERRSHRDLGLAVADVAAQQPVHRPGRFQIGAHLFDRLGLVRGFLEFERRLELPHQMGVGRKREAGGAAPLGIEREQLVGHVGERLADLLLGAREGRAAEPVELGPAALDPGVALD